MAAWETFERCELWEPVAISRRSGAILSILEYFIVVCLLLCNYYKTAGLSFVGKSTRRDINIEA